MVGTRTALPGFEPGEHLHHLMPTPMPAGCLPMTRMSAPLRGSLLRSTAYTPERDSAPSTGTQSTFSSATHPHSPSRPSGRAMGSCCFPACFCREITSHHPPRPLCVLSAADLVSRTVQAQVHQMLLNPARGRTCAAGCSGGTSIPQCEGSAAHRESFVAGRTPQRSPTLTSDDFKGALLFGLQGLLSPGAQPVLPENWLDKSADLRDQRHKLNGCEPGFYEHLGSWVQAGV